MIVSLLGVDIGTNGCKSAVFSTTGQLLALSYREYDHCHPQPGWAELDAVEIWDKTRQTIRDVVALTADDPVQALAVTSLGEAVVPVSADRQILGPSLLNYGIRGQEFGDALTRAISEDRWYELTGQPFGTYYSLTKIMWTRVHDPQLYQQTDYFLPWTSFIAFMLGAEPTVDLSLANRTLMMNLEQKTWSSEILSVAGIEIDKLPKVAQAGTVIGEVSADMAAQCGLRPQTPIVIGAHDQCTNAVGCGAIQPGQAMLGMGTFVAALPVYEQPLAPGRLNKLGVNTEYHAIADRFISMIYNQGGSVVKWYRDTYAAEERERARQSGEDLYEQLFDEVPLSPGRVTFLPYLSTTGLPDFSTETSGVITGLRLTTQRGEILRGIIEGIIFDIKYTLDVLSESGLNLSEFIAVGGGSRSNTWVQTCADILGCRFQRPAVTETGALGAAILAGVGTGVFVDPPSAVSAMVRSGDVFEPDKRAQLIYQDRFEQFLELRSMVLPYLKKTAQPA